MVSSCSCWSGSSAGGVLLESCVSSWSAVVVGVGCGVGGCGVGGCGVGGCGVGDCGVGGCGVGGCGVGGCVFVCVVFDVVC